MAWIQATNKDLQGEILLNDLKSHIGEVVHWKLQVTDTTANTVTLERTQWLLRPYKADVDKSPIFVIFGPEQFHDITLGRLDRPIDWEETNHVINTWPRKAFSPGSRAGSLRPGDNVMVTGRIHWISYGSWGGNVKGLTLNDVRIHLTDVSLAAQ